MFLFTISWSDALIAYSNLIPTTNTPAANLLHKSYFTFIFKTDFCDTILSTDQIKTDLRCEFPTSPYKWLFIFLWGLLWSDIDFSNFHLSSIVYCRFWQSCHWNIIYEVPIANLVHIWKNNKDSTAHADGGSLKELGHLYFSMLHVNKK